MRLTAEARACLLEDLEWQDRLRIKNLLRKYGVSRSTLKRLRLERLHVEPLDQNGSDTGIGIRCNASARMSTRTHIAARLDSELVEQIDRVANSERRTRTGQIEYLLLRAMIARRTLDALRLESQALLDQGDLEGHATLERIIVAMDELRQRAREGLPRTSGEGREFLQALADGLK